MSLFSLFLFTSAYSVSVWGDAGLGGGVVGRLLRLQWGRNRPSMAVLRGIHQWCPILQAWGATTWCKKNQADFFPWAMKRLEIKHVKLEYPDIHGEFLGWGHTHVPRKNPAGLMEYPRSIMGAAYVCHGSFGQHGDLDQRQRQWSSKKRCPA